MPPIYHLAYFARTYSEEVVKEANTYLKIAEICRTLKYFVGPKSLSSKSTTTRHIHANKLSVRLAERCFFHATTCQHLEYARRSRTFSETNRKDGFFCKNEKIPIIMRVWCKICDVVQLFGLLNPWEHSCDTRHHGF